VNFKCFSLESEKELYDQLEELLSSIWVVIQDISAYGKGASDDVRDALQNSDNLKIQSKSFEKVKNLALKISTYYSLSKTIEEVWIINFQIYTNFQ
jgi:hypothetical protein